MTDKEYRIIQKRRSLYDRGNLIFKWIKDAGQQYKKNGNFPLSLTDYYEDPSDVEVAAMVETLIPEPLSFSSKRISYITELHNILGKSPSNMVNERTFFYGLLSQKLMDGILGRLGVQKSDIFNMLDWIWEIRHLGVPMENAFAEYAGMRHGNGSVPDLSERISHRISRCAINMALMRLCLDDGVGRGVWHSISKEMIPCPTDNDVLCLLRQLYPIERFNKGMADEIITYLGWDEPCEFLYSYLACIPYRQEMKSMAVKLRRVMEGKTSDIAWERYYGCGAGLMPGGKNE